jgi:hypothetical protein
MEYCVRYGSRTLFRAEAGWPSFALMAAKQFVIHLFARVKQMGTDSDAAGKQHARGLLRPCLKTPSIGTNGEMEHNGKTDSNWLEIHDIDQTVLRT